MKKSDELKQERASKFEAQEALVNLAEKENRGLTEDEQTKFDTLGSELDALEARIQSAEAFEKRQKQMAAAAGASVVDSETREKEQVKKRASLLTAVRDLKRGKGLSGAEKELDEIGRASFRAVGMEHTLDERGITIPMEMVVRANAQTKTEDSGSYGGVLVKDAAPVMQDPFLPTLTLEQMGATVYSGLQGDLPLTDSAAYTFESLAETADTTPQKVAYTERKLEAKRIAAEVHLSNQLLAQSAVSVEADVRRKIGIAADRKIFLDAINGAGSATESLGLLNDAITDLALGASAISRDKIIDLWDAVNKENATNFRLAFLSHPSLKAAARKAAIDAGSGQFIVGADGKAEGFDWFTHSDVPVLNTGTEYPLIFGDWANMNLGFFGGGFQIMVDNYTKAGANSVRLIVNMHKDAKAGNPKGFATIKTNTI